MECQRLKDKIIEIIETTVQSALKLSSLPPQEVKKNHSIINISGMYPSDGGSSVNDL